MVAALRYKPGDRGFDSRWCHWNFSLTLSFRPHYDPGNISLGVKAAGAWGRQPYHLQVPTVLKSGSLNLLEPSGPVQDCNGIALPFFFLHLQRPLQIHDSYTSPSKLFALASFCQKTSLPKTDAQPRVILLHPRTGYRREQKTNASSSSIPKKKHFFTPHSSSCSFLFYTCHGSIDLKGKAPSTGLQTASYWLHTWNKGSQAQLLMCLYTHAGTAHIRFGTSLPRITSQHWMVKFKAKDPVQTENMSEGVRKHQ